ncbi:Relaxase/Mobilisation nuclease domain-containing protein [Oribacterium sp. KHPX15]|uniref:relaxase/mobilization nuclease domain-containing protein n=1 Tax=Oribacterium sp. KHPX15 TaxID=1855342 RepID=UPI0008986D42|nr:relaxase/mobilization nuclease domain-containing protein [Oribacterium sp. KHPX15]SEA60108.1 Relaxase/Mobilisation nuclease domain-containing protein [Oribacterium sp. KHPX15]
MVAQVNNSRDYSVATKVELVEIKLIWRKPKDWEDFLRLLSEEGYEIRRGKNIAIKGRAQQRFVRLKSLGEDYTEDALKEKISRANVRDSYRQTQQPCIDLLIDIQNRALGKGAGYER